MKQQLVFKTFYPHSPQRVWEALTEPKALAKWLAPTTFRPQIGFRFRFGGNGRSAKPIECTLLELKPGKRICYTWDDGEAGSPSVVRWTIHPKDGGTELRLVHESSAEAVAYVLIEAHPNWRLAMGSYLPALLATMRQPVPTVYAPEENANPEAENRRAGFRQELACV